MHKINFNEFDHNFCEALIYSTEKHPEYINAFSSLFISFVGFNGLLKSHLSLGISLLYSCLIINGISSFLYHYYNNIGFGLTDRMSMVLIAMSCANIMITNINKFIILENQNYICFTLLAKIINITSVLYFTLLLTITGLHMENEFNMLFGLFLFNIFIFIYLVKRHSKTLNIPIQILKLAWKGFGLILVGGIFWITTELLCKRYNFIKYLFGHMFWHICISYGGYLITLLPQYMFLSDKNKKYQKISLSNDCLGIPFIKCDNEYSRLTNQSEV